MKTQIRITEKVNHKFITDIKDDSTIGYKYFNFENVKQIALEVRGKINGTITVTQKLDGTPVGIQKIKINTLEWITLNIPVKAASGVHALYFSFSGTGDMDMKRFTFLP